MGWRFVSRRRASIMRGVSRRSTSSSSGGSVRFVTSAWAQSAPVPSAVFRGAAHRARQLGRGVVSDDLFLLALTDLDESQPARRALTAAGVSRVQLLAHIRTTGDDAHGPREGGRLRFSPAYYTLHGLAQGFAATLGDGVISPEHVLLAILWMGNSLSLGVLRRIDVTRETVVHELSELGIRVPQAELPLLIEVEWGERVWFERDQVGDVLDHVRLHIEPVRIGGLATKPTALGYSRSGRSTCTRSSAEPFPRTERPSSIVASAVDGRRSATQSGRESTVGDQMGKTTCSLPG